MAALDSNVYLPLKKAVNSLYIHTALSSSQVHFENVGKASVREAFKNTDKELQKMIKVKNKTFKELRGIWLHETLETYVKEMEVFKTTLDPTFRFTKIMDGTISALKSALDDVTPWFNDSKLLFEWFQKIREVLGVEGTSREERERTLEQIYDTLLTIAEKRDPSLKMEDCKAFLPSKSRSTVEILLEWCRLWNSYRPGLFQYYTFPHPIKTNMEVEQGFSKEKQALFNRVAKANVSRMIATRGEDYLRLKHCNPDELNSDIILEYADEILKWLRAELLSDNKEMSALRRLRVNPHESFKIDATQYYQ